jgi:hypothetical protein
MQNSEIEQYFEKFPFLKKLFRGFYSINTLKTISLRVRQFCICNTDVTTGPGIHWFCLVRTDKQTIECFDRY